MPPTTVPGSMESSDITDRDEKTDHTATQELAVVMPVMEAEEPEIPQQILSPDDKPAFEPKKFPTFYVAAGIIIFVLVVTIGSICGTGHCGSGGGSEAMESATGREALRQDFELQITAGLRSVRFGLDDENSAYEKALDWIINADPKQLEPDADNLLQRFILALLYYHSTERKPWYSCNPPQGAQDDTCQFFLNVNHVQWGNRWLSGSPECQWGGVFCESGVVTVIELNANEMNGQLPAELGVLPKLTKLDFSHNELTGTIPSSLMLTELDLGANQFAGTIPAEIFNNPGLESLNLENNTLTGTLPTDVGLASELVRLSLGFNRLSGLLPNQLFGLSNMERMVLQSNQFTGTLSEAVGNLVNMQYLFFGETSLDGPLPSQLGLLTILREMDMHNSFISGTIPEELFTGCSELVLLYFGDCNLSGTISTSVGLLTELRALLLANNNLSGTIPEEMTASTWLYQFSVNGNQLSGSFPSALCSNLFPATGTHLAADCGPEKDTGIAAMPCLCCTECCEASTGICSEV
ncbi:leucine Rich Repeat [Seminavis robusta]|uniref:Leucine Rich Repeat n=1 Tax=Seminavis robusta TaxID=568900 RepID=A0A9N8DL56_9STRA|nr:leucine Rich Repeat [Seminavis robusta]|eukprot:Sro202_g085440.1 leucine Rich Repeat (524) ;mRNA; f:51509-53080